MPPRVVVLGSLTMDLVFRVPRFPAPGETLFASGVDVLPGGKGLNQAIAAARLGADAAVIGAVGEDAFGDTLLETLRADGVDTTHVARIPGVPTATAVPVVAPGGENFIIAAGGANQALTVAGIETARATIEAAGIVVAQFETPVPTVLALARIARDAGVPFLFNPAPALPLPPGLLDLVSVLVVNEVEAAAYAPSAPGPGGQARELRHAGAKTVIVTLGADGGCWDGENGPGTYAAHDIRAIDTVGAGDAFCGALAWSLATGRTIEDAVGIANGAAALSVQRAGAAPSLPRLAEVMALLEL